MLMRTPGQSQELVFYGDLYNPSATGDIDTSDLTIRFDLPGAECLTQQTEQDGSWMPTLFNGVWKITRTSF